MEIVVRPCPVCGSLVSAPDTETRAGTYVPLLAMIEHYEEAHPERSQPGQGS